MPYTKTFLDNFFKENREKRTLLLTQLEVLFDFLAMVKLRSLDVPTVKPSSSKILNRMINHWQTESRFIWTTKQTLIWLQTSIGKQMLIDNWISTQLLFIVLLIIPVNSEFLLIIPPLYYLLILWPVTRTFLKLLVRITMSW